MQATAACLAPERLLSKWAVGDGQSGTLRITLQSNGGAEQSPRPRHGIGPVEGSKAQIHWDGGRHEAIRETGGVHEEAR